MEYLVHIGQVAEQAGLLAVELGGVVFSDHAESTHVELADHPTLPNDVLHHGGLSRPGSVIDDQRCNTCCWVVTIWHSGALPAVVV